MSILADAYEAGYETALEKTGARIHKIEGHRRALSLFHPDTPAYREISKKNSKQISNFSGAPLRKIPGAPKGFQDFERSPHGHQKDAKHAYTNQVGAMRKPGHRFARLEKDPLVAKSEALADKFTAKQEAKGAHAAPNESAPEATPKPSKPTASDKPHRSDPTTTNPEPWAKRIGIGLGAATVGGAGAALYHEHKKKQQTRAHA